ncbi:MAG: hypothetical protein BWZ02_00244 [Lentisphaerae bacterium ADurb.BinA184]|nr:MAG: hypothetical protein BWZ02_00244 [Lentisphaerae bacterium ADurb.BinA184]
MIAPARNTSTASPWNRVEPPRLITHGSAATAWRTASSSKRRNSASPCSRQMSRQDSRRPVSAW